MITEPRSHKLKFIPRHLALNKWLAAEMRNKTLAIRYQGEVFPAKYGERSHDSIARRIGVPMHDNGGWGGFDRGYIDC